MRVFLVVILAVVALAERPKKKDMHGNLLVRLKDVPTGSCGDDSYFGVGVMNGSLEECSRWQKTDPKDIEEYEQYKCKHLRVHAIVISGKCICRPKWKGPICNDYDGCPEGETLVASKEDKTKKVCTANICQHDGEIAVGKKEIECICKVPWDGRYCERLACFRKTNLGQEKRFNNDVDKCKCGKHYKGENCDEIVMCHKDAEPVNGKCVCPDNYGGELCDRKCPVGQITCSSSSLSLLAVLLLLVVARH